MSKTDDQLRSEIEANESRGEWGAWAVVAGLVIEIVLAAAKSLGYEHPGVENWGSVAADCLIALGVYSEIHFARRASRGNVELRRRSDERVAEANARAAEANKVAEEERHARVELEAQLRPRSLTPEQFDLIQGLRGKFTEINVARETDIETHVFAMALSAAGIMVRQYRRAADVHTAGIQIYAPLGFDDVGIKPLFEVFRKIDPSLIGIAGPMSPDIPASTEVPMIIVGGRFTIPRDPMAFSRLAEKIEAVDANNKPQDANAKRE
jgi:hypothetical protein